MSSRTSAVEKTAVRGALIDAAHNLVRMQGLAATSVDQICAAAGVTKGAFFHYFKSKEALAVAAAEQWTARAAPLFDHPSIVSLDDPLDRLFAHIDLRLAMLDGVPGDFTCFVGSMVQEAYATSEAIRVAGDASITAYAERLAVDVQQAIDRYRIRDDVTAESLAYHIQAVLQGAFVLAKAKNGPAIARESVEHLKRYVQMLFN